MILPFATTEHFPDGDIGLNIFDGDHWERHKLKSWDEVEIELHRKMGAK